MNAGNLPEGLPKNIKYLLDSDRKSQDNYKGMKYLLALDKKIIVSTLCAFINNTHNKTVSRKNAIIFLAENCPNENCPNELYPIIEQILNQDEPITDLLLGVLKALLKCPHPVILHRVIHFLEHKNRSIDILIACARVLPILDGVRASNSLEPYTLDNNLTKTLDKDLTENSAENFRSVTMSSYAQILRNDALPILRRIANDSKASARIRQVALTEIHRVESGYYNNH